ncbi:MAG TPA: TIGR03013 family XrtA/PEP-CTERM system glycosyltransferase [Stellaceae bacterium]|jgi:sugar transferase (PEP-CTERM system associated)|nr:TIGR03013 family XrtA/PEP-CTERM system glycosyltransferase [Stellaceae bacterium]
MQLRLFRHFVPVSVVLLITSDAVLITAAFYQMLSQSNGSPALIFGVASFPAQLAAGLSLAAIVAMVSIGLYGPQSFVDLRLLLSRVAVAFVIVLMLVVVSAAYWRNGLQQLPDSAALPLKGALLWLGCILLTRATFLVTLGRGLLRRRVVVLGNGTKAARIAALVATGENHHFVPVSFVGMPGERSLPDTDTRDWAEAEPGALADLGCRLGASEIVVATDERRGLPVHQLLHCKLTGIRITDFLDFWERETRTVDLEALRPAWLFYSDGFRCGVTDAFLKRCFDITVSLALLIFSLPLLVATACLIKLESPGPVLYRQERIGLHGRVFTIFKFRSMHTDAEGDGRPRWAAKGDPRVTNVGAVIRKLRIDELAQILNVLRGDMSFVGPRPERPYFVDRLSRIIPYYAERHWVRPGITGWAQINYPYGASTEDARRKLAFDLYYVKNRSIFLDFLILLQTARVIFWNHGAR